MDRAQRVAEASDAMVVLRDVLAQERPVVLRTIEMFGAEMYRMGLMEARATQGADEHLANDMQNGQLRKPRSERRLTGDVTET